MVLDGVSARVSINQISVVDPKIVQKFGRIFALMRAIKFSDGVQA